MTAEDGRKRSGKEGQREEIIKEIKLETMRKMNISHISANLRRPIFSGS
jgi:hypothetical protein